MLMKSPYLTAQELGLTPDQHEGLVRTLAFLREHPDFEQHKIAGTYLFYKLNGFTFSMNWWNAYIVDCGTVHCLGGTCEFLMGKVLWEGEMALDTPVLHRIFYPGNSPNPAYNATPTQAADVLEHYLMTGEEIWDEVMASS